MTSMTRAGRIPSNNHDELGSSEGGTELQLLQCTPIKIFFTDCFFYFRVI
jgi:hypothetical protein